MRMPDARTCGRDWTNASDRARAREAGLPFLAELMIKRARALARESM
jgi:hypothetical protein